jgi:hypothetical protein
MKRLCFLLIFLSFSAYCDPSWFSSDTKTPEGWIFYCKGDAKDEKESLSIAQSECARKMCMLFGVEVKYQQVSEESLQDAQSKSTVIESCPLVRIVGRTDKKKSVDCEDGLCVAFISQFYPMAEYEKEKKRLDNPPISPTLAKTIIIRENNETFLDPKDCRQDLKSFKKEIGVTLESQKARVAILSKAQISCKGLDYRNVDLQSELNGYIYSHLTARGATHANMLLPLMTETPGLLPKVDLLLKFESFDKEKALKDAQKLLAQSFEYLFFVENKSSSYLNELKTCDIQAKIVKSWPAQLTDDVSVCLDPQHCQTTSILMLRSTYAACLCRNGAPQNVNPCIEVLSTHMNNECPLEMNQDCFKSMSTLIAEKMKFQINNPYLKSKK